MKKKVKIDSENCITTHPIKDSWNREEVVKLLNKLNNTLNVGTYEYTLEDWIKENLN